MGGEQIPYRKARCDWKLLMHSLLRRVVWPLWLVLTKRSLLRGHIGTETPLSGERFGILRLRRPKHLARPCGPIFSKWMLAVLS